MPRFQILSLIGGGIRGAFITAYLKGLEERLGRNLAESFDLIAGTSTGGIIAAGLAMGKSAAELHDFYVRYGAKIFTPRPAFKPRGIWRLLYPMANLVFKHKTGGQLDAAFRARFCPDTLEGAFREGFGTTTLGEVEYTRLILAAYNLTDGVPHMFRSRHLPKGFHDRNVKITDAVIASTAAPTYFPHKVINGKSFIDGGVWAADPSVLAFAEAMRTQQYEANLESFSHCRSDVVHMLSIGTGIFGYSLSPPGGDAGLLYWAPRIADVMGMAQIQGSHLPLKFVLGDRYQHINFEMEEHWPLDGIEFIPKLFQIGEQKADDDFDELSHRFFEHNRLPFVPVSNSDCEIDIPGFVHQPDM